jgi:hypothetical protein
LPPYSLAEAARDALLIAAAVIATRLTWYRRPQQRLRRVGARHRLPSAWAGFRGGVSLAHRFGHLRGDPGDLADDPRYCAGPDCLTTVPRLRSNNWPSARRHRPAWPRCPLPPPGWRSHRLSPSGSPPITKSTCAILLTRSPRRRGRQRPRGT